MTAVNVTLTKYMGSQIIFKEVYMWEIRVWKLVLLELSRIGSFLCLSGVLLSREKVRRGCTLFS